MSPPSRFGQAHACALTVTVSTVTDVRVLPQLALHQAVGTVQPDEGPFPRRLLRLNNLPFHDLSRRLSRLAFVRCHLYASDPPLIARPSRMSVTDTSLPSPCWLFISVASTSLLHSTVISLHTQALRSLCHVSLSLHPSGCLSVSLSLTHALTHSRPIAPASAIILAVVPPSQHRLCTLHPRLPYRASLSFACDLGTI